MRKYRLIVFMVTLLGFGTSMFGAKHVAFEQATSSAHELFLQANQLYKKQEFAQAFAAYQNIAHPSAIVNYNLGNCAYHLKKYGYALLYWFRAERKWGLFNRYELRANIALVKERLGLADDRKSLRKIMSTFTNFFVLILRFIPLWALQILFLSLWLLLFLFLRCFYRSRQKWLIGTLFCFVAIFGMLLPLKHVLITRVYGIITVNEARLLSGPGISFQLLNVLPEGKRVLIKKESGDYSKIKVDRQIGWMHTSSLTII